MENLQLILKLPHSKARIKVGNYPIEKGKIIIPFVDLLVALTCRLNKKKRAKFWEEFQQIAAEEIPNYNIN